MLVDFDWDVARRNLKGLCRDPDAFSPETDPDWERFEKGEVSPRDFFCSLGMKIGFRGAPGSLEKICNDIFSPMPERLASYYRLARQHRTVIVSNTNAAHFQLLRARFPFLRFSVNVLSYQVAKRKPDPEIFEFALYHANCQPTDCLFLDDIPANVHGAQSLGIPAVRVLARSNLEALVASSTHR